MNAQPVVVNQAYSVPPAIVWKALTEPETMRQWYFPTMPEFKAEVGFEIQFDVECEGRTFPHQWKVTEVVHEQRITYGWRYAGHPGDSTVTWGLKSLPDGTHLTLTHAGLETFPQDDPLFKRESCEAGWTYLLKDSLMAFLEK